MLRHFQFLPKYYIRQISYLKYPKSFLSKEQDGIIYRLDPDHQLKIVFTHHQIFGPRQNEYYIKSHSFFQSWKSITQERLIDLLEADPDWETNMAQIETMFTDYMDYLIAIYEMLVSVRNSRDSRYKNLFGTNLSKFTPLESFTKMIREFQEDILNHIDDLSYDAVCLKFQKVEDDICEAFISFTKGIAFTGDAEDITKNKNLMATVLMNIARESAPDRDKFIEKAVEIIKTFRQKSIPGAVQDTPS
jgi:hypothetical protein